MGKTILTVEGRVGKEMVWSYEDLDRLPTDFKIEDAEKLTGIPGTGVKLSVVLAEAAPHASADHATFHSQDGNFAASLPLKEILSYGILLYKRDGRPLPDEKGGPIRLLIPQGDDACANVKSVTRIELTHGKGRDTTGGSEEHVHDGELTQAMEKRGVHGHGGGAHDHPHSAGHQHPGHGHNH